MDHLYFISILQRSISNQLKLVIRMLEIECILTFLNPFGKAKYIFVWISETHKNVGGGGLQFEDLDNRGQITEDTLYLV